MGVPGTGGSVPGVFWGALALSFVTGFFFVRGLVRPRVVEGSWAPMVRVPIGGDVDLMVTNRRARVEYEYLTSHPSYALLLLLTVPLPLSMWYFSRNEGDSTFYWRITGIVGLSSSRLWHWRAYWLGTSYDSAEADSSLSLRESPGRSLGSRCSC